MMRATALGKVPLIVPQFSDDGGYYVHCFSLAGNWCGSGVYATRKEAAKARKKMFAYHARLAAERDSKKKPPRGHDPQRG